ncbi:hypothetical protein P3T76_006084 [Phytophthora citrophthora]|uniref:Uncharacterized protein n=1 Tax=Phytophthora citrophthora TaxID=4793 RepID=A0AAD9GQ41_9STRA|nr:hypothetical protein P3T76_006084 [Phytophthora citrophthora]
MLPDVTMEQRWGFLSPWCNVLLYRIHYRVLEEDYTDAWRPPSRALQVILPTRTGIYGEYRDEQVFQIEFQNTREALALLAAVAHVDLDAWRYLLSTYCGLDSIGPIESAEEDIPVRFVLLMERLAEVDLVQLCGTTQRRVVSEGYVNCMQRISALSGKLHPDKPGFDVEIPVRVIFNSSSQAPIQILESIQNAEKLIREEWESYNWSLENQPVENGQLRCSFHLEPMIGDFTALGCASDLAETMAQFVGENVWFSQLSLKASMEARPDHKTTLMSFRQMMAVIFDAARRSEELANTRYGTQLETFRTDSPLQLGNVVLECDSTLGPSEFESMFSAIVLTQTTKKLNIKMSPRVKNRTDRRHWWKWLAYGCFSERARTHSALQSLILTDIDDMSVEDMGDLSAVLSSEHPEEMLYGSAHGIKIQQDMMLWKKAPVQWLLTNEGQPRMECPPVKFSGAVPYVRTLSDDGKSDLVNVLIPGFGRCLVNREDLVPGQDQQPNGCSWGLKSLTLQFAEHSPLNCRGGLPHLLSACGSSLLFLTIDGPGGELDVNAILRSCPNLLELCLRKGGVRVLLNFSDFHARKKSVPKLRFKWHDVAGLTTDLSNMRNPFTKCLRRLSIGLINLDSFGSSKRGLNDPTINSYLDALLQMLAVNQTLEYLEVIVPSECPNYRDFFRIHHLRAINRGRKLSMTMKLAFLSIVAAKVQSSTHEHGKAMKRETWSRPTQCYLDSSVISNILGFATSPVFRQHLPQIKSTCKSVMTTEVAYQSEKRWGFLRSWTRALTGQLGNELCRLQSSPFKSKRFYIPAMPFNRSVMTQEGLKLLAAVAYVDHNAWKYLLLNHCGVKLGEPWEEDAEREVVVQFHLTMIKNDWNVQDLVQMCGIQQHDYLSREYSEALARIAANGNEIHSKICGVEIPVPIVVHFINPTGSERNLDDVLWHRDAGEKIQQDWVKRALPHVEAGAFRCTFVFEWAIKANLSRDPIRVDMNMAEKIEELIHTNVWFSVVSLEFNGFRNCEGGVR